MFLKSKEQLVPCISVVLPSSEPTPQSLPTIHASRKENEHTWLGCVTSGTCSAWGCCAACFIRTLQIRFGLMFFCSIKSWTQTMEAERVPGKHSREVLENLSIAPFYARCFAETSLRCVLDEELQLSIADTDDMRLKSALRAKEEERCLLKHHEFNNQYEEQLSNHRSRNKVLPEGVRIQQGWQGFSHRNQQKSRHSSSKNSNQPGITRGFSPVVFSPSEDSSDLAMSLSSPEDSFGPNVTLDDDSFSDLDSNEASPLLGVKHLERDCSDEESATSDDCNNNNSSGTDAEEDMEGEDSLFSDSSNMSDDPKDSCLLENTYNNNNNNNDFLGNQLFTTKTTTTSSTTTTATPNRISMSLFGREFSTETPEVEERSVFRVVGSAVPNSLTLLDVGMSPSSHSSDFNDVSPMSDTSSTSEFNINMATESLNKFTLSTNKENAIQVLVQSQVPVEEANIRISGGSDDEMSTYSSDGLSIPACENAAMGASSDLSSPEPKILNTQQTVIPRNMTVEYRYRLEMKGEVEAISLSVESVDSGIRDICDVDTHEKDSGVESLEEDRLTSQSEKPTKLQVIQEKVVVKSESVKDSKEKSSDDWRKSEDEINVNHIQNSELTPPETEAAKDVDLGSLTIKDTNAKDGLMPAVFKSNSVQSVESIVEPIESTKPKIPKKPTISAQPKTDSVSPVLTLLHVDDNCNTVPATSSPAGSVETIIKSRGSKAGIDTKTSNSVPQQPPPPTKGANKKETKLSPELLGDFDVYNIETAMPTIDWAAMEAHLTRAAKEDWYLKRQNDREEIRRKLAMDSDNDEYYCGERVTRKPSLTTRLQSGMNLQICFMNETASDLEGSTNEQDTESRNRQSLVEGGAALQRVDGQNNALASADKLAGAENQNKGSTSSLDKAVNGNNANINGGPESSTKRQRPSFFFNRQRSWKLGQLKLSQQKDNKDGSKEEKPQPEEDFLTRHARLQAEARLALAQAKEMARMQMEVERQQKKKSPIADIVGIPFPDGRHRLSRQVLTDMNVAQLQVIVNDLHSQIESLNEDLVRLLLERDDLHMEQDSMLVDIEDLTRYLGAKDEAIRNQQNIQMKKLKKNKK